MTGIDLSKLVEERTGDPPLTTADGERHYFIDADAMTLRQRAQLRNLQKREAELVEIHEPTAEDEREYDAVTIEICELLLPTAPRAVLQELKPLQRNALYMAFLAEGSETMTAMQMLRSRIGASRSLDSNGSTEGPRTGG